MYPAWFRRHFNFILYFMILVATAKYLYVLFEPEFDENKSARNWFIVLGLSADINKENIYGKNTLLNLNYLIIFTGFIQYNIYISDFAKNALSAEQTAKDVKMFANRFPILTKILIILVECIIMMIPWITYLIFFIINIVNSKSLINFVLLILNLLLLFWHICASLITKKSHRRLTTGWRGFTFVAAVLFLIILIFQIGSLKEVANLDFIKNFIGSLPDFITKNHDIIGLESYIEFTNFERIAKFLAYVAYFNLSVITQRQFERSANKVKEYEVKKLLPVNSLGSDSSSETPEVTLKVKFSVVYVVHKLKILWPIFNTISWHIFTILAIVLSLLAIHWRLSVASLVYIIMLMVYFILTPFFLQPNLKKSRIKEKEGVTVQEMKELWEKEDKNAKQRLLFLRNQFVIAISLFTIICIGILHLSANLTILADRYKTTSKETWESLTFITFWCGVNYTKMYGGNTYLQEIWGYLFVLIICFIERKAQIWLYNKLGYEGSVYENYLGRIVLDDLRGEGDLSKKISNAISAPLEEIKEEDEFITESLANPIVEETKNLDDIPPIEERKLTPEEIFEKEKKHKVKEILSMEYKLFISKAFRVILFVIVILMTMLSSFYKCNIWGLMLLSSSALFSLCSVMFRNVKWFTLAVSILLIVQYISVLLNVSYETKTSVFPDPFQDPLKPRPIPIPIYRHFGEPITNTTIVPDQGTELPVPQPWGFFLGLIVSRRRFNNLWVDYLAILVMHYFFIYFYSVSYELDMGLNTKEAVSRTISNINNEVGDSVIQSFAEKEENKSQDYRSSYDEIIEKSKKTNYFEAQKYIDKVKSKMILSKFYEGVSTTV